MKIFYLLFLCITCLVPSFVNADTSDFYIHVVGGEDTEAPTTPTLLSAIPTAATQIDLVWSTSTDNVIVSGYVLFRDSVIIATTSQTSYLDTGLTASTTYSYEVYAFDGFLNISSTSNAISTTTLALPVVVPPTVATSTNTDITSTQILKLIKSNITPSTNSALFSWETNYPSRFTLRWGRNDLYDEGYIVNDRYQKEHQTMVTDLEPGTVYEYELVGYAASGRPIVLETGNFSTVARESLVPPNVQDLWAEVSGVDVELRWTIPPNTTIDRIRIVRSHLGFPSDPYDGAVVYEGQDISFVDVAALLEYDEQFYTIFAIGEDGSISSGAVARASVGGTDGGPLLEEELIEVSDFYFSPQSIALLQGSRTQTFSDSRIVLSGFEPFVVSIPYAALPRHLKSIIVTLLDPSDHTRSYSFLLRINKDRTAYEAMVASLETEGVSRLQVEIFDYERKVIGRYRKQIDFVSSGGEYSDVIFPDVIVDTISPYMPIITVAFVGPLFWMFIAYRRSRDPEDNN